MDYTTLTHEQLRELFPDENSAINLLKEVGSKEPGKAAKIGAAFTTHSLYDISPARLTAIIKDANSNGKVKSYRKGSRITLPSVNSTQNLNETQKPATGENDNVFYKPKFDKEGNFTDININYKKWIETLNSLGFYRFDIEKDFVFIRVKDQVVEEMPIHNIQDQFIKYLKELPKELPNKIERESLLEKFYKNPSNYFCDKRLSLLPTLSSSNFKTDTKTESFIYYQNGFVKCNDEDYVLYPYSELSGYIWKSQIIKRTFKKIPTESKSLTELGVFANFVFNISGQDNDRFNSLCTIIGYNLHSYFERKLKATVLTDSTISENPEGRTGKTLLCKSLGFIKNYQEINGKDFKPDEQFKYQQIKLDAQIVCLNDVRAKFDFESVFNDITEGIKVNKKQKDAFTIRVKMLITTNRTLNIIGGSAKDRAIEFELSDHYKKDFGPDHEFKHWFFVDWSNIEKYQDEWYYFDNFMMYCLCLYFSRGLVEAKPINLDQRKLLDQTCSEFVEWIEEKYKSGQIKTNFPYNKKALHQDFLNDYDEFKDHPTIKKQQNFTKWLRFWCQFNPELRNKPNEDKSGSDRTITFLNL